MHITGTEDLFYTASLLVTCYYISMYYCIDTFVYFVLTME